MPLQATSGAASQDAFGGNGVAVVPTYIEDIFSCFLYTGNGTTQTITNGIDLAGKGGMVWVKRRDGAVDHALWDTVRVSGSNEFILVPNNTDASTTSFNWLTYNNDGFTISAGASGQRGGINDSGNTQVSWTFREQPKFFDVVTYTGTSLARTIAHNLGSVPGCIIIKCIDGPASTQPWAVYHRGTGNTQALFLNLTQAPDVGTNYWNDTTPTSTVFSLGASASVNNNTSTYIAYLFAHDAGGFGLTGTDNVISCGGFTANGNNTITLGYEPQWVMVRRVSSAGNDWEIYDTMRGCSLTGSRVLVANTSGAEGAGGTIYPTATGFYISSYGSGDIIYIAIRRGPMKVPTTGTSVFSPNYQTASTGTAITTNFPPDLQLYRSTAQVTNEGVAVDRLRGVNTTTTANSTPWLDTTTTAAEASASSVTRSWGNTGFQMPGFVATIPSVFYSYRRAPSFMDVVCYTGNNVSGRTITHNLAAVPELMIVKSRTSATRDWIVYDATNGATKYMNLNNNSASGAGSVWVSTAPTSTVFTVSDSASVNDPAQNYVAYLFATCAGVSKVGSYTGNGTTQTIDCGFGAGGARFVLIKRTDSTGDWYVYDTARGMTALTDPYLLLNSTAAEVATLGSVTTVSTGFAVNAAIVAAINTNAASYIFLAIS